MSAQGYGEAGPVATNETEAGRALNRRIEFTALE
jgi:OOP family OmpA-OmpF porin